MAETLLQEVAKNLARKEGKLSNVKADLAYLEEKFEWKPCSQKDEERYQDLLLEQGALEREIADFLSQLLEPRRVELEVEGYLEYLGA